MQHKPWIYSLAPAIVLALLLTGCSKPAGDAATAEAAAAAEAEVAAAEQKLAEAERAIADAKAAEDKLAEAQRTLDAAKRELASAKTKAATAATAAAAPAGSSGWSQGAAKPVAPKPPPPPREYTLAAGSPIVARTTTALSTKDVQTGASFEATLHQPLEVDGYVIAPRGARVTGQVADSDPGGRVKGVASLSVRLVSVQTADGETLAINTGAYAKDAPTSKKKDAAKVGIGAGIGAAIGAIAGGGKGAAIGAAAGGAAGTGAVVATRGDAAVIPAETVLTFSLTSPVTVTEKR
jgi:hypothetical protein